MEKLNWNGKIEIVVILARRLNIIEYGRELDMG